MASIQELEQKIQNLEREIIENRQKEQELLAKSDKALDYALHAYRIDHNGYVWVWDTDTQDYRKTKIHLSTPEVEDKSITERKMADDSVSTRTIQNGAVTTPKIKDKNVTNQKIDDKAVTTDKIGDKAITPEKLNERVLKEVIMPPIDRVDRKYKNITDDLQNQIDSFNEHGLSVSNQFGDDPHIGISQKTLTEAFNAVWAKLADITGEVLQGISMKVTPSYYIGEQGATVHITATSIEAAGVFEQIEFYWNDATEPFAKSDEPVRLFEFDTEISDTTLIRCRAKILGVWYEEKKLITHYDSFWLGAGANYQSVMVNANLIPVGHHMRGAYDVTASAGNRIFIILGESLAPAFIRADMNGVEIAFTQSTVTINDNTYVVFTSQDTYQAGTYNIDING